MKTRHTRAYVQMKFFVARETDRRRVKRAKKRWREREEEGVIGREGERENLFLSLRAEGEEEGK